MQNNLAVVTAAVLTALSCVEADLCAVGRTEVDGNWFCQPVQAIRYSNVGTAGSYNQVINMTSDGSCSSVPKHFSGPLSPLDEEVSLHFRGPLRLKQLAVYNPSKSSNRKRNSLASNRHRHQHGQLHKEHKEHKAKQKEERKRQVVTATIEGQVVTWENNYSGEPTTLVASASPQMVTATIDGQIVSWVNNWFGGSGATTTSSSAATTVTAVAEQAANAKGAGHKPATPASSKTQSQVSKDTSAAKARPPTAASKADESQTYGRIGYYHSTSQTLENLVFLGNHGGQGSGVFDYKFGASLSYVNRQATGGAASPQILADTTIPSDAEVVVMLGQKCVGSDCGYIRPGTVGHHGFGGADKVFLIEFSMPIDGTAGFNADMPAIWMLNAQIPRTLQYGDASCSCWESGCGEFDIAETLYSGSTYLKSTLHTNTPGGDSDYIMRPTSDTMKLAVIFSSSDASVHIQVLPGSTEFPDVLTRGDIDGLCSQTTQNQVSHFRVS